MRNLLRAVLALFALGVAAIIGFGIWIFMSYQNATVGKVDFGRPLTIPKIAPSTIDADGTRAFKLDLQKGKTDLGKDEVTNTWGIVPRSDAARHPWGEGKDD